MFSARRPTVLLLVRRLPRVDAAAQPLQRGGHEPGQPVGEQR